MTTPRPLARDRQRQMITMVREHGTIRIGDLVRTFEVSDETVRRDLTVLEQQGVLVRTRGGAVAEGVHVETSLQRRLGENQREKRAIARYAASLVRDGSTIVVDSGSTMSALVDELRDKSDLVVITNGVNHVERLLFNPSVTVVVAGGMVRRATQGTAGQLAVDALRGLRADHTFIATHGFAAESGMTYPSFEEVEVKRAMIAAGVEVTLLADGSKCGRASMVHVAPLTALDRIVTSPPVPPAEEERIRALEVDLVVVEGTAAELHLVDDTGNREGSAS